MNPSAFYRGAKGISDFFRGVKAPASAAPGLFGRGITKIGRLGVDIKRGLSGEAALTNYHTEGLGKYLGDASIGDRVAFGIGAAATPGVAYGAHRWAKADEPQIDQHGNMLAGHDEEKVKQRQKFMQDQMLGANKFSPELYKSMRGRTKWVDTAIDEMGVDRYNQFRDDVAAGADPQELHNALVAAFTKRAHPDELKDVGKEGYVLPGLYSPDGRKQKVLVMNPVKDKAGKQSFGLMDFDADVKQNR